MNKIRNKPKMIVFDCGNTLLYEKGKNDIIDIMFEYVTDNPYKDSKDEIHLYFEEFLLKIKTASQGMIEISARTILANIIEYYNLTIDRTVDELELVIWKKCGEWILIEDVERMLRKVHEKNIRMAIISNIFWSKSALEQRMREALPNVQFEMILSSSDYIFRKPHNYMFELILKKTGLKPEEVWYCGNSMKHDIIAADNVGMYPILIDISEVNFEIHKKYNLVENMKVDCLILEQWKDFIHLIEQYDSEIGE